jgi:hypothetical protein
VAILTATVGTWDENRGALTLTYNDANNAVQSVAVNNQAAQPVLVRAWPTDAPAQAVEATVPAGTRQVFSNLGGGWRYSPVELPPGDPKTGNVGFSISYPAP